MAVVGSAGKLIIASRGKRLSQHNSGVCPQRVSSAVNLVLCNFVPWERNPEGSGRHIYYPSYCWTMSACDFWCLDVLWGGGRERCWTQSLNTSRVCEWEGVRTGRERGLHRRGADREDTGSEAAPVPAQYAPSRASSGSQPSAGIFDGSPGQALLQSLLHPFLACRWETGAAGGSICWGLDMVSTARLGKGVAGHRRLCRGGLAVVEYGTSNVTCQLAILSPVNTD